MPPPAEHIKPGTLVRDLAVFFNDDIPPDPCHVPPWAFKPWYNVEPKDLPDLLPRLALNQAIRFRGGVSPGETLKAHVYLRDPAVPLEYFRTEFTITKD